MDEKGTAIGATRRGFLLATGTAALALGGGVSLAASAEGSSASALPEGARAGFALSADLTYLNNGTLGPCPVAVMEATRLAWRELERNPADEAFGPSLARMEEVRAKAAAFLGCQTEEIVITRNTTDGMNTVAEGVDLKPGERVLMSDHEHPGGSVGWEFVAKRRGAHVDRFVLPIPGEDPEAIVRALSEKLTNETRVISVPHVTYSTGLRLPIARIAAVARERGCLLVVDGAQAPGVLGVDVKALGCDAYATSAHKWMLAPKGTGLLYVATSAAGRIDPLLLSSGMQAYTAATGTRDIPGIIGLGAAIDFLNGQGKPAVESHAMALRAALLEGLSGLPKLKLMSPRNADSASAIVTVAPPEPGQIASLAQALRERHKVIVAAKDQGLRISLHVYNTPADVERLVAALSAELKG